jgi:hypothetical protein
MAADLFYHDSRADRFKLLMRSPGRDRTVTDANTVEITTDESEVRLISNARATCAIIGITFSMERVGPMTYRFTLLDLS